MSAQTRYGFFAPLGVPGGIADLAPYAIDTFLNEAADGVMKFGVGVVSGSNPGVNIDLPQNGATAAKFEGVTVNNRTTEYDVYGKLAIRNGASIGVMRYGRVYVCVAEGVEPKYGDAAYVIAGSENEDGYFTNVAEGAIAVKGRFLGNVDAASGVALVELFNQANA